MAAAKTIPGGKGNTRIAVSAVLLAAFLFSPAAFAKHHRKSKSSPSSGVTRKKMAVHYWPPVRNFTTVVIDAGHGGHDPGGIFGQRIPEKPYTLDVALRLRAVLRKAGFETVLTRSNDTFIPLPERVRIANARHNAIFVSIHFNSSILPTGHGFETYYYAPNAQPLAARIQAKIMRALPTTENRGVKSRGYYVLRKTSIPSVLVEGGFLTNPNEARTIQQARFRQQLAQLIAQAIIQQRDS
jgi:N-acetylmuramoyl-L-alanine amidase